MMIRSKDTTIQSRAFFTSQKIQLPKTIKEDLRDKGQFEAMKCKFDVLFKN